MRVEELLARVVASERCGGQHLALVEACVELLHGAGWLVLCRGGGPVELRQERESFLVQRHSCAEVRLHCGGKGSASDGRDCLVITALVSVGLFPKQESATLCDVKNADLEVAECPPGGGYLLQLFRLREVS